MEMTRHLINICRKFLEIFARSLESLQITGIFTEPAQYKLQYKYSDDSNSSKSHFTSFATYKPKDMRWLANARLFVMFVQCSVWKFLHSRNFRKKENNFPEIYQHITLYRSHYTVLKNYQPVRPTLFLHNVQRFFFVLSLPLSLLLSPSSATPVHTTNKCSVPTLTVPTSSNQSNIAITFNVSIFGQLFQSYFITSWVTKCFEYCWSNCQIHQSTEGQSK